MEDASREKLDSLMDRYDERRRVREQAANDARSSEASFAEEFRKVRQDVIRPTMDRIASQLKARGHKPEVETTEPPRPLGARFRLTPAGARFPTAAFVAFEADVVTQQVKTFTSKGPLQDYGIREVHEDMVQHVVIDFVKQVLEDAEV
jgi:hypothetical protein